jgi:hypothetical protein
VNKIQPQRKPNSNSNLVRNLILQETQRKKINLQKDKQKNSLLKDRKLVGLNKLLSKKLNQENLLVRQQNKIQNRIQK